MTARSGGRLLVEALAGHGVDRVFCVPGESYLDVLDALHDSDIDTVVCRHEGGAAYMAEAYGKLHGRPGVAMVTRGPGAANAFVGIHTAWQDATPMVLFVGLVPRAHRGREAFQEFDLAGWFGTTAKQVLVLEDPARAPEVVAQAFHAARHGRPGPVVVGLPEDVLVQMAEAAAVPERPVAEGAVSDDELARLRVLLDGAERPLVLVGGSRWTPEAVQRLTAWAQEWQLPVAADFRAQDLVDHRCPGYAGHLGYGRDPRLARRLDEADLVLAIGCPLGDVVTDGYTLRQRPDATTVLVSPDPGLRGHHGAVTLHLLASPAAFAAALDALPAPTSRPWAGWTADARRQHVEFTALPEPGAADPDAPVDLSTVMTELLARLPEDAVVTYGAGNHALWPQRYLPHRSHGTLLAPRNGSMGYGVPAAVAACLSHPERVVVSVAGDGCFLMNAQEIGTAVQHGAAPVVLVVDNGQYGTIRAHQEQHYPGRVSGTQLRNPDFAGWARSFGGHGERVERDAEVAGALDRAFAAVTQARVPAVVHLVVDPARLAP